MIKIITEAKADFDRVRDLCVDIICQDQPESSIDDARKSYTSFFDGIIEQYKKFRDKIPSPKNDITYWYNKIRSEGYSAVKEFSRLCDDIELELEAKEWFYKSIPSSIVRRFEKNKKKLSHLVKTNGPDGSTYRYWLDYKKRTSPEETIEYLRRQLEKVAGYSEEEKEEIESGTEIIDECDGWTLYYITTYLAAEYYGRGTGWCVSGNYPGREGRGRHHFEEYLEDADPYGYFFLIKGREKYCIFNSLEYNEVQIWQGTNGDDTKIKIIPDHVPDEIVEAYNDYNDSYGTSFELKKLYIPETEDEQREVIYKFLDEHDITRILVHTGFDLEKLVDQYVHEYYSDDDDVLFENIIENKIKAGQWFPYLIFSTSLELYDKKYGLNEKPLTQNEFNSLSDSEKENYLMRNISPIVSYMEEKFGNIYYFLLSINEEPNHRTPSGVTINKVIGDLSLENDIIVNLIMNSGLGKSISLQIANNRV